MEAPAGINGLNPLAEYSKILHETYVKQHKNLQTYLGWDDYKMNLAMKCLGGLIVFSTIKSNLFYVAFSGVPTYLLRDKSIQLKNVVDEKWAAASPQMKTMAVAAAIIITLFCGWLATICLTAYTVSYMGQHLAEKQGVSRPLVPVAQGDLPPVRPVGASAA